MRFAELFGVRGMGMNITAQGRPVCCVRNGGGAGGGGWRLEAGGWRLEVGGEVWSLEARGRGGGWRWSLEVGGGGGGGRSKGRAKHMTTNEGLRRKLT